MAGPTKKFRKLAILAKIEVTYGVDPTPSGAANAMVVYEVEWTPLDGEEVERDNVQPHFGQAESLQATQFARLKFKIPFAGSGAVGTAPKWGPLLRACSIGQTVNAGVSTVYAPVSSGQEALTLYCNIDGVNQVLPGAMGDGSIALDAKGRPCFELTFTGLWQALTDTALPTADYSAWVKEVAVNKANTIATIHGVQCAMSAFRLNFGNQVEKRDMTDIDVVDIVNRKAGGSITIQQSTIAFKDWVSIAKAKTKGNLSIVHGITAGNILTVAGAASMELGNPSFNESQGVQMITLPFRLIPSSAGNDEWSLTNT